MRLQRINPNGQKFYIDTICNHPDKCRISIAEEPIKKSITVSHSQQEISMMWHYWTERQFLVQNAFPGFTDDEREFLISGTTPEEWEKMFPKENE